MASDCVQSLASYKNTSNAVGGSAASDYVCNAMSPIGYSRMDGNSVSLKGGNGNAYANYKVMHARGGKATRGGACSSPVTEPVYPTYKMSLPGANDSMMSYADLPQGMATSLAQPTSGLPSLSNTAVYPNGMSQFAPALTSGGRWFLFKKSVRKVSNRKSPKKSVRKVRKSPKKSVRNVRKSVRNVRKSVKKSIRKSAKTSIRKVSNRK